MGSGLFSDTLKSVSHSCFHVCLRFIVVLEGWAAKDFYQNQGIPGEHEYLLFAHGHDRRLLLGSKSFAVRLLDTSQSMSKKHNKGATQTFSLTPA